MLEWYYLALLSSFLMGVATLIEKNMLKAEHATAYSSACEFLIAIICLVFVLFANFNLTVYQIVLIYVFSLLTSAAYLITARVYKHGSVSVSSPAFSALPILFTVILAFVFLNEQLAIAQYVSIAGIIVATYMIMFKIKKPQFESGKYRYMVVVASFLLAVAAIISKYLLSSADVVYSFIVISELFNAINFMILITIKYNGVKEIISTIKMYKLPIISVALLTVGYRLTYYFAIAQAPISLAYPLRNTICIIMTVLLGGFMFKEGELKRKLALSIMMLFFLYLLVMWV